MCVFFLILSFKHYVGNYVIIILIFFAVVFCCCLKRINDCYIVVIKLKQSRGGKKQSKMVPNIIFRLWTVAASERKEANERDLKGNNLQFIKLKGMKIDWFSWFPKILWKFRKTFLLYLYKLPGLIIFRLRTLRTSERNRTNERVLKVNNVESIKLRGLKIDWFSWISKLLWKSC